MIRILTQRPIHASSWQRWILYPDPESLSVGSRAPSGASDAMSDFEAFTRTVSSIRVGRIYKLTGSGRLVETTRALVRQLKRRKRDRLWLLDVGASDGATTLDAIRELNVALAIPVFAVLMDRYVRLERRKCGWLREYCMPDGSPVMLRLGPVGLQLSSISSTRNPVSRWLGNGYLRCRRRRGMPTLDSTLSLIHPAVAASERIRVVEWNVLDPNPELRAQFDAVRASNILNEGYFSREQIELALSHIHGYLVEGGLLLISRNHLEDDTEVERGSLWQRTAIGFQRVEDFGSGSYVAGIVDAFELPRSTAGNAVEPA